MLRNRSRNPRPLERGGCQEPETPFDAIVFDCDGTLSHIEGIDELAKTNHVGEEVMRLTAEAMGVTGINPELYQKRLDLVLPTPQQVQALGRSYFEHQAPDLLPVIKMLQELRKAVYIVSAGLYPAVVDFAKLLELDPANVFAVDIYFDTAGNYRDFDHSSPLVHANGKRLIAEQLCQRHKQIAYVGDGMNDYDTHDVVARFIGYGGAFYRENIKQKCQYYISAPSMAPLGPLILTKQEVASLTPLGAECFAKGLSLLCHTSLETGHTKQA